MPAVPTSRISLAACAALALAAQDPSPRPGPSKERVAATVERIETALKEGTSADRTAALEAAALVPDKEVARAVAKGLGASEVDVRRAAIECLRVLEHAEALQVLHAACRRERELARDPELGPALWRAVGQHGSPSSIEVLADDPFGASDPRILHARLLALANIRTHASVEALMSLMNRLGGGQLQPHMDTFRLALARLTGVDHGVNADSWQRWWNDVKQELVVTRDPPKLKKDDQQRWDQFWGREPTRGREGRRNRRGSG